MSGTPAESSMPAKAGALGANLRGASVSASGAGTLYQRRESKSLGGPKPKNNMDMTETEEDDTETDVHDTDGGALNRSQGSKTLKSAKDRSAKSTLPEAAPGGANTTLEADRPLAAKLQTFKVRALWTMVMVVFFMLVIYAGHMYCSLLVLGVTMGIYREILRIKRNFEKEENIPLFFFLRWYFFACTMFSAGVKWLTPLLESVADKYKPVRIVLSYNAFLTFTAAVFGFVLFVLSLRKYTLRYQFRQLAWIVVTLLVVVVQSSSQIANIYSGFIWFLLPTSMVIVNDIFAYVFGVLFGKTRLIALSPKKTWEGFLGAFFVTILWSQLLTSYLSQYKALICPQETVTFRPGDWSSIDCTPAPMFVPRPWDLPETIASLTGVDHVIFAPVMLHAGVLGVFAAIIAPFGGFFASGFKRAFKIKDFGDSIPGHGGITDRFDCQIMMGMFTYMYLRSFVWTSNSVSFGHVYASVMSLEAEDQMRIYAALKDSLAAQNLL